MTVSVDVFTLQKMGDTEYIAAMVQVVLPVAYQFDPDLVFISAGFDAAHGDPIGGWRWHSL